jgi:hypothetical protein
VKKALVIIACCILILLFILFFVKKEEQSSSLSFESSNQPENLSPSELNEKILWKKEEISEKHPEFDQQIVLIPPPSSDIPLPPLIKEEEIPTCSDARERPMRITVKHIEGGGIGYNQGYSTLGGFFSFNRYRVVPFIDLRSHVFNDGKFAANAGLGVRGLLKQVALGINAYYDYRNTHHQHYNQIGVGVEVLGARWEARANGYLPVGRKKSNPFDTRISSVSSTTPYTFDFFSGNEMFLSSQTTTTTTKKDKVEFAMKGINAEIGYHVFKNKNIDLFAGIGPYYFKCYYDKKAVGGKARLTANFTEYFYVTGIYSNDSLFHSRVQGEVGINIPFGPQKHPQRSKDFPSCDDAIALQKRLVQPVARQEIIVVSRHERKFVSEEMTTDTVTRHQS